MLKNKVNIYFDESGKRDGGPQLMGGVLIPRHIYDLENIGEINKKLKSGEVKYHFTDYTGSHKDKENYLELIRIVSPYLRYCSANILNYKTPNNEHLDRNTIQKMIYTKFPERIFYGLLRNNGNHLLIDADIYMESADDYTNMIKTLPLTLNIQSVYRCENFMISNSKLVPKNEEIGVEFTDTILGMVRQILMSINYEGQISKTKRIKDDLMMDCLKVEGFYEFLSNINYYEWSNTSTLKEVNFEKYVKLFMSKQLLIENNKK